MDKWSLSYYSFIIGMLVGLTFSFILYDKTHHMDNCKIKNEETTK